MIAMTRIAGLVLPFAIACAGESARAGGNVPADLTGTYTFVGADTSGTIPWAARAELTLVTDSTFEFDLRVRVKGESERETAHGTYRVEGDRLRLTGSARDHDQTFELLIRGDSLVMDAGWVALAALRLVGVPRPVLVKES
jgi:hypothetical protein